MSNTSSQEDYYTDGYDYSTSDGTSSTVGGYLVPSRDVRMRSAPSTGGEMKKKKNAIVVDGSEKEPTPNPYVNVLSIHEFWEASFYRALAAEFFATSFFVGFSVGGVAAAENSFAGAPAGNEHAFLLLFHMLLVLVVIFSVSAVSGAHFNCAVTFGTLCTGRITAVRCAGYFIAQMLGAVAGAAVMVGAIPGELEGDYMGTIKPGIGVTEPEALLMEFYCTFGLLFGAFAIAFDPRGWGKIGPLGISVIIGINIHVGSFISGAAMNPARAFGPALVHGHFDSHWIYWVGGLLGGMCGATSYEFLFMNREHARTSVPTTAGDARIRDH